jgi:hypothetical protein
MAISAEVIKLFYDLWDDTEGGRELLVAPEAPEPVDKLSRSAARDIHQVMTRLNRIGHLAIEGPLDGRFVSTIVGKEIIAVAARLQPYLAEERSKRQEPEYLNYLDRLNELCKGAYPNYEPRYLGEEHRRAMGLGAR